MEPKEEILSRSSSMEGEAGREADEETEAQFEKVFGRGCVGWVSN